MEHSRLPLCFDSRHADLPAGRWSGTLTTNPDQAQQQIKEHISRFHFVNPEIRRYINVQLFDDQGRPL